jgi:PAS domain-containing protein
MTTPEGQTPQEAEQQVNELLDSPVLTRAVETEEFRVFLDHIPIAIVVSKLVLGDQRVVYANKEYEKLVGKTCAEIEGRGWSILNAFFRCRKSLHLVDGSAPEVR